MIVRLGALVLLLWRSAIPSPERSQSRPLIQLPARWRLPHRFRRDPEEQPSGVLAVVAAPWVHQLPKPAVRFPEGGLQPWLRTDATVRSVRFLLQSLLLRTAQVASQVPEPELGKLCARQDSGPPQARASTQQSAAPNGLPDSGPALGPALALRERQPLLGGQSRLSGEPDRLEHAVPLQLIRRCTRALHGGEYPAARRSAEKVA